MFQYFAVLFLFLFGSVSGNQNIAAEKAVSYTTWQSMHMSAHIYNWRAQPFFNFSPFACLWLGYIASQYKGSWRDPSNRRYFQELSPLKHLNSGALVSLFYAIFSFSQIFNSLKRCMTKLFKRLKASTPLFFPLAFYFFSILASGFPIVQTHLKNKTLTSFVAQSFGNEDGT